MGRGEMMFIGSNWILSLKYNRRNYNPLNSLNGYLCQHMMYSLQELVIQSVCIRIGSISLEELILMVITMISMYLNKWNGND